MGEPSNKMVLKGQGVFDATHLSKEHQMKAVFRAMRDQLIKECEGSEHDKMEVE